MIVISLGAGVQSTTLALMAAHGEIGPMPDCAIFADTGWEPKAVYAHLDWLESVLPFPVHRVTGGNLRADALTRSNTTGQRFAAVPWFMKMPNGDAAMGRRQCTKEYKLRPIQRKVVELQNGKRRKGGTEMWLGISLDEIIRFEGFPRPVRHPPLASDRTRDAALRLPQLARPPRLSRAAEISLHRLSFPRQCPVARTVAGRLRRRRDNGSGDPSSARQSRRAVHAQIAETLGRG